MDPMTVSLIIALMPVVEKLAVNGIEIFTRKDLAPADIVAALETSKQGFADMTIKA